MNIPETFFTVHEQLILFGLSCVFGAVLGVCYDVFRTLRVIFPHNTWLVVIEDVLFLIGYAVFLSVFASAAARGELRFYYVVGNIIGFIIYFFTVGSAVISTMKKLFSLVSRIVCFIMRPFSIVYVFLREKAGLKFVESSKVFVKSLKNVKSLLLKSSDSLYNKKENKKRKNVKNVAEKSKIQEEKKGSV